MMTNDEFLARLDRTGECWLWMGGTTGRYGKVYTGYEGGKRLSVRAHRFSYEMFVGPIGGLHVCHRCDVPLCCRPEHLFLGTNADNTADRVAKGRTRTWATERSKRGSEHPRAKVTEAQVLEARAECVAGRRSMISYSREWGVSSATSRAAITGMTWTHI